MVVIAAVDRSDRGRNAVAEAAEIAGAFGHAVHVVHVLSRAEFVDMERTEVKESGRPADMEEVRAFAAGQAETAAEGVDFATDIEYVGLVGDAADEILDYAENHDARYIVVGPRKKSPTGKALFGSVSQEVLLNAGCPVVATMPE